MRTVSIADAGSNRVGVQIILLLSQGNTTLTHIQDIVLTVFLVGTESETHELLVAILQQSLLNSKEVIFRCSLLQLLEVRQYRSNTLAVTTLLVHGELVEIAQFLLHGAFLVLLLSAGQVFQNRIDPFVVILLQLVEAAEA